MKSATGDKFALPDETKAPATPRHRKSSGASRNKDTNNHHVVPLGILVVLCTVYLIVAGVQRNYRYYFKPGVAAFDLNNFQEGDSQPEAMDEDLETQTPDTSCQKIDIFGKDSDRSSSENQVSKRPQGKPTKRSKNAIGNGVSKQPRLGKSLEGKKKDATKKSNTAEPIIYLFALVFIYLLLKAASDINQHYKSNKGDKRLRRCSLQSYAQIHKQDRRSSKVDESPIFRRRHILGDERSVSVDRYKYTQNEEGGFTKAAPKVLEYHHRVISPLVSRPSQQQHPFRPGSGDNRFEPRLNRRSSVPISINYQTVHVSSPYPPELTRRGSVISLTGQTQDVSVTPSGTVDPKRRVRMINRH
ncbi:uncharacterized protein LOC108051954 isoform X2 [Drosophila rhopaloa]|uniref:Uncharacterized protein LOC108051954 isoform X2 n=1 Tax=Drosophila rhopaloa TaxID=1041015 RepID=A0A6P4FH57_DRORH|nr:uncharacterized protein LOC108051954 isoform X2 [Drosophila rhopaloa]